MGTSGLSDSKHFAGLCKVIIYIINSRGPMIEACGTPVVIDKSYLFLYIVYDL